MIHPYMPASAAKLASFFGLAIGGAGGLSWADLGGLEGLSTVSTPEVLFSKLEDDLVAEPCASATPARRRSEPIATTEAAPKRGRRTAAAQSRAALLVPPPLAELPLEERFERLIDLRVAKIVKIERHPKADKLYIETLDDGSGTERVIVSGLVPFYREEELLGKRIVLVNNLKPAKLRGVESKGMLLAASRIVASDAAAGESGHAVKEAVEVLDALDAAPGTRVNLEGRSELALSEPLPELDVDAFFSVPIAAQGGFARIGSCRLLAAGRPFALAKVPEGEVG